MIKSAFIPKIRVPISPFSLALILATSRLIAAQTQLKNGQPINLQSFNTSNPQSLRK